VRPQRFDRRQQNRRQPFISAPSGRPARALDPVERLRIGRREHAEVAVEQPVADRALQHSSTEVRVKAKEPCATGRGTGDWAQEILVRASSPLLLRMTSGGIGSYQTRDQISG
jgi:antitoxin (DNA-binding transcriptional repressor) of toxin-antitoxin stability system